MNSRWNGLAGSINSLTNVAINDATSKVINTNLNKIVLTANQPEPVRAEFVESRINAIDPSFYECFYRLANSADTVTDLCHKDVGCCASTCCSNTTWNLKYGWAVALIVLFCLLAIAVVAVTLSCWLINRAKDKKLRQHYHQEPKEIEFSSAYTSDTMNGFPNLY